jgi:hypothetical protein
VKGTLESLDRIEIVSHGGQISSSAVIRGKNGTHLPKLVIESWGNRVASGPAAGFVLVPFGRRQRPLRFEPWRRPSAGRSAAAGAA